MLNSVDKCLNVMYIKQVVKDMREWLSGGAPPCQGGGRGFDPRLALSCEESEIQHFMRVSDFFMR